MRMRQGKKNHDNNSVPASEPALVVGCHGGAGTTTIARLLGDDAVEWWDPLAVQLPPAGPTVFVAHANPYGALKAAQLLGTVSDLAERSAVLVAVDDGRGPQPYQAKMRYHALGGLLPILRFPYVMRWRYVDDPLGAGATIPPAVQRVVRRLRQQVFSASVTVKG